MKILLVTFLAKNDGSDMDVTYGGVEYYRMIKPHAVLRRIFPDCEVTAMSREEFNLEYKAPNMTQDERVAELKNHLSQFDLILFNREMHQPAIDLCKELGKWYALDLDDYWILPGHHELSDHYRTNNIAEKTIESIKNARFVIVTTPFLAEKVKPHNENVYVIENGVDFSDETWQPQKSESKRLRFGFTQGSTHFEDLKMLQVSVRKSLNEYLFRAHGQIVLCGFGVPNDPEFKSWKKLSVFQGVEVMFTEGHRLVGNANHVKALRAFEDYNDKDAVYRRVYGMNVLDFPSVYHDIDVSVASLKENTFNSCKSELKMIEAGAKGCAIILHHVKPYTLLATDKNSFNLNKRTFREWAKYLIQNRNAVKDSASQLRLDIEKYSLETLSKKRYELYKKYVG